MMDFLVWSYDGMNLHPVYSFQERTGLYQNKTEARWLEPAKDSDWFFHFFFGFFYCSFCFLNNFAVSMLFLSSSHFFSCFTLSICLLKTMMLLECHRTIFYRSMSSKMMLFTAKWTIHQN